MMELILGGLLLAALILLYYAGKRAGKVEQKNDQLTRLLQAQASVQSSIDAQFARYDSKMEKMEKKVYGVDIHMLSDAALNQMWEADSNTNLQTDPTPVDKPKTEGTEGL